jgi:hypothetical protein
MRKKAGCKLAHYLACPSPRDDVHLSSCLLLKKRKKFMP